MNKAIISVHKLTGCSLENDVGFHKTEIIFPSSRRAKWLHEPANQPVSQLELFWRPEINILLPQNYINWGRGLS
jgi:hypothetical protein